MDYLQSLRKNIGDFPGESCANDIHILHIHQDHVPTLPAGIKPIGGTAHSPILGSYNKKNILTFQGHPEFTKEMLLRCIENLKKIKQIPDRLPEGETLEGIQESLNNPCNDDWVADCIVGFVLQK